MSEKKTDVEQTSEKKSNAELSEKELEQTAGGIAAQYGRPTTPQVAPYIEQETLRK